MTIWWDWALRYLIILAVCAKCWPHTHTEAPANTSVLLLFLSELLLAWRLSKVSDNVNVMFDLCSTELISYFTHSIQLSFKGASLHLFTILFTASSNNLMVQHCIYSLFYSAFSNNLKVQLWNVVLMSNVHKQISQLFHVFVVVENGVNYEIIVQGFCSLFLEDLGMTLLGD